MTNAMGSARDLIGLPLFWLMLLCGHYLVDPVACTPASGEGSGREPGWARPERFFAPRLRFKTLGDLNAWLLDKCIASAKAHRHPELGRANEHFVVVADGPAKLLADNDPSAAGLHC